MVTAHISNAITIAETQLCAYRVSAVAHITDQRRRSPLTKAILPVEIVDRCASFSLETPLIIFTALP